MTLEDDENLKSGHLSTLNKDESLRKWEHFNKICKECDGRICEGVHLYL